MTGISLDPALLRDYTANAGGPRDDVTTRAGELQAALAELTAALPAWLSAPTGPDTASAVTRVTTVDGYVGLVAAVFEQADRRGADGLPVVDDAALAAALPLPSPYTDAQRAALRVQAEAELASLRERIRDGDVDQTTTGELIGVLGLLDHLVGTSPDPEAEAAALIDTMGPGDLHEALRMLEAEALAGDDVDATTPAVAALGDLARVAAYGLEGDPERAARWVDDVAQRRDIVDLRPNYQDHPYPGADALVVLAANVPPDAGVLGTALFNVLPLGERTPEGGLVHRLYDTRNRPAPILDHAAESPGLANGLVNSLLEGSASDDVWPDFDSVFNDGGNIQFFWDTDDATLHDVLVAAVDPSLDPIDRAATAYALTEFYVEGNRGYSDDVTRGLAATTQPLLEAWRSPDSGDILVVAGPGGGAPLRVDDGPLWDAVGAYAEHDAGIEGLSDSVRGASSARLVEALEVGAANPAQAGETAPLDQLQLDALDTLHGQVAAAVNEERIGSLVDALEAPGGTTEALDHAVRGVVGHAPGGSLAFSVVDAYTALEGREVTGGGNPLAGAQAQVTVQMAMLDLLARPELATPEVARLMNEAMEAEGEPGLFRLLTDSRFPDPATVPPELVTLRDLVLRQSNLVNVDHSAALAQSTSSGG